MNTTQHTQPDSETAPTPDATMFAWAQHRYGGPEVVNREEFPVPVPAPNEVLVRLHTAAVNSADMRITQGNPFLLRLAFGLRKPKVAVQGRDASGVVVAIGDRVSRHRVGDLVTGEIDGGGFAEFFVTHEEKLVKIPENVTPETAAALPLAAGTAWQALDAAAVNEGSRVLLIGAGGGVGLFAARLAVLRGAHVHALSSARAIDAVVAQGVEWAKDRREHANFESLEPGSYDVIIELGGNTPLRALRRLLTPEGTIIGVAVGENRIVGPLFRIIKAQLLSIGNKRRYKALMATAKPEITERLLDLASRGELVPVIDREYPLSNVRAALEHLDGAGAVGKLLVRAAATTTTTTTTS